MRRVLIADDEEHVRETIKAVGSWERLGISAILEARDGLEAFEILRREQPDLVIVDMKMPYVDGAELIRRCAGATPNTKYVIVSGYDDFEYMRQAIRSGIVDYILKPIDPGELNEAMERAIKGISPAKAAEDIESAGPIGFTAEIKKYIDKNYSSGIRLDMFSKRFYMTREYILKKFKEDYRLGIYEYATRVRMETAKKMLDSSGLRIQEISDRVGFKDSNYFSKAFKKYYGLSPREYRENRGIADGDAG